jgi:uncharacterized protein
MSKAKRTLLEAKTKFKFNCNNDLKCFKCCIGNFLYLHPYDILPIRKRLGISSEEFLSKYTFYHIDKKTSLILVVLKSPCPFLMSEGCSIYIDRPIVCRYFPIGAFLYEKELGGKGRYDIGYFLSEEPLCLGLQEDLEWTIEKWKNKQGIIAFDDLWIEWNEILSKAKISDEHDQAQIYIAGHDFDRFRRFIFKTRFLDIVYLEEEEINKIKTNDIALMKFGFKYLKHIFNIEKTLQLKKNNNLQFEDITREIMNI